MMKKIGVGTISFLLVVFAILWSFSFGLNGFCLDDMVLSFFVYQLGQMVAVVCTTLFSIHSYFYYLQFQFLSNMKMIYSQGLRSGYPLYLAWFFW